jgi:ataxia telangiectasia mutated family protein
VVEDHLGQAIRLYEECKGAGVGKAHFTLAQFSDSLYQGFLAKAASSEWAATQELRRHKERELTLCEQALAHATGQGTPAEKELGRHAQVLRRVVEGDRQDSRRLTEDRDAFLTTALSHYIDALLLCDRYDVRAMFRLCSLWFTNASLAAVNGLLREKGASLPSHKFLPLIYQITSRMSATPTQSGFQDVLCAIIERVATSHPHHVLYQLFALKNGEIEIPAQKGSAKKTQFVIDEDKVRAAKTLLAKLQRGTHAQLLTELSTLIATYIDLTCVEPPTAGAQKRRNERSTTFPLPTAMQRLPSLTRVVVPTMPPESQVHMVGFSPMYTLCGGRSAPKIVECIGSDGRRHKQLVKVRQNE